MTALASHLTHAKRSSTDSYLLFLLSLAAAVLVSYRLSLPLAELRVINWFEIAARAALALASFIFLLRESQQSKVGLTFRLSIVAVIAHFPGRLPFHFDEWQILWKYSEFGFRAALMNHGEHVIPLFLAYYLALLEILQFSYPLLLVVSLFLLGWNGAVLEDYLRALGLQERFGWRPLRLSVCLFVTNAFHLEVSQWAFDQCVLLQNIASLLAATCACRWIRSGSKGQLLYTALYTAISPLLQGTGFVTPALVLLSAAFCRHPGPFSLRRLFTFLSLSAVSLLPAVAAFVLAGGQADADGSLRSHPVDWLAMGRFFLSGVLGATVLRGLGLLPSLSAHSRSLTSLWDTLPYQVQTSLGDSFNLTSVLGGITLVGILILLYRSKRSSALPLFILGSLILAVYFAVPTLGRWYFGVEAALHQRYHTRQLLGLCLIVLPLLARLFERERRMAAAIGWCLIIAHVTVHRRMEAGHSHFIVYGEKVEEFISRLKQGEQIAKTDLEVYVSPHYAFTSDVFRKVVERFGL